MTSVVVTQQVRQHFSSHADEYDRYAVVQKRVVHRLLNRFMQRELPPGPVIDLGCGTGELARQFSARYPTTQLVVADIAHQMSRCAALQIPHSVAVDCDAVALPLRDDQCAILLSSSMYQWVNDLESAFAENFRVLQSGGIFAFALFAEGTLSELRTAHRMALVQTGQVRSSHMHDFPSQDMVAQALSNAGFVFELENYGEVEEHPDVATLLRNLKRIGAQNAAAERPAGLSSRRVTQRMMDIYTERYACNGTIPATYRVLSGIAHKAV